MVNKYMPKIGDIVFIDMNPVKGHEQGGYRPAVVISKDVFNKNTKMVIVCPITSNIKDFPTHYIIKNSKKISGAVLCEHVRSIDYEQRKLKYIEKMEDSDFENVMRLFYACLDKDDF